MDNEKKEKQNILEKLKNDKKAQYFVVGVLIVVAVAVVLLSYLGKPSSSVNVENGSDYAAVLEKKLSETLSEVEGAGRVSVVITVESEMETVLAMETIVKETAEGIETIETPIVVNGKTIVLKELYPKVTGVLIVAEGAKSIAVLNKIQQATVSLLNINVNCIEILSMK